MKQSMRKIYLIGIISLLIAVPVFVNGQSALNTKNVQTAITKSFDNERITVAGTAIGFTASKINPIVTDQPSGFSRALVASCVNGAAEIIVLSTGGTPTTTNGLHIAANQSFTVYGYDDISNFLTIRNSSSSTIDCIYSRLP